MQSKLKKIVTTITSAFTPVSIFLYGSRARTDYLTDSDYEIGVLHQQDNYISRQELEKINQFDDVFLYPFSYEDFLDYKIDSPFPEKIYFRELIEAGKTLFGEDVINELAPPKITVLDILQRIRFDTGMALAAVLSQRNNDKITAATEFSKSCLLGVRNLIILESNNFPLSYDTIHEQAQQLDLGGFSDVVSHAYDVRNGAAVERNAIFKNISLLNERVKNPTLEAFQQDGDVVLVE